MSQLAAILLMVACPADLDQCREASVPQPMYEMVSSCQSELAAQPPISIDGKQLLGTCIPVDPAVMAEDAEIIWDVSSDRNLTAEVQLIDEPSASLAAQAQDVPYDLANR